MAARKKKIDEKEQQVSFEALAGLEEKTVIKEEKKTARKTKSATTKKADNNEEKTTNKTKKSTTSKKSSTKEKKSSTTEKSSTNQNKSTTSTKKKATPKKDRKINITQEDMDKLCEVYDWYLRVKDTINYNAATEDADNKDVVIEETDLKDTKKAYLNIDRQTWEDFDVLCSNCGFKKNEVLTQIIKDFLREHRNLF